MSSSGVPSGPGAPGAPGADGKTVRNGAGAPAGGLGVDGDFYLDTDAVAIYGPKTAGAWGSPTSLIGPSGQLVVRLATRTNISLSGVQNVDGDDSATGNLILVKNQSIFTQNGVWVADDSGAWAVRLLAPVIYDGLNIYVKEGSHGQANWQIKGMADPYDPANGFPVVELSTVATGAPILTAYTGSDVPITLSGLDDPVGGVTLTDGMSVFAGNQGSGDFAITLNGIWLARTGDWERPPDFDDGTEVVNGSIVKVLHGDLGASVWQLWDVGPTVTVGTTALKFRRWPIEYPADGAPTELTLPIRLSGGELAVGDPTDPSHAATAGSVAASIAAIPLPGPAVAAFDEDWLSPSIAGKNGWATSGMASFGVGNSADHPGWAQITTTAVSATAGQVSLGRSVTPGYGPIDLTLILKVDVLSVTLNRYVVVAGLTGQDNTSAQTDGVFVRYQESVSGNYYCVCVSGGTETAVDSGVAVTADTFDKIQISVDEGLTSAKFTIDGTQVADISTNIPTLALAPAFLMERLVGVSSRTLSMDLFAGKTVFSTSR